MPVSETLAGQWLERITDPWWWYNRVVDLYAWAYWYTGDGDGFLAVIEKVCIDCDLAPLDEGLARRLTNIYPDPLDQYRLSVSLGTSALWYQGHGHQLLDALHGTTGDAGRRSAAGTVHPAMPEEHPGSPHEHCPPAGPTRRLDGDERGNQ
jgi:hypothetical protein